MKLASPCPSSRICFSPCFVFAHQLESLRKWNLGLAALHFGAAVIQFAISSGESPTFSSFPNANRGKPTWAPALKFLYNNQVPAKPPLCMRWTFCD